MRDKRFNDEVKRFSQKNPGEGEVTVNSLRQGMVQFQSHMNQAKTQREAGMI